jgi:hypothetical protein
MNNIALLNAMGILPWIPRTRVHAHPILKSAAPLWGAACLVILSDNPPAKGSEADKIFTGMLKVLNLNAEEYCIACLNLQDSVQAVCQAVSAWAPHSVLLMGEELRYLQSALEGSRVVYSTYHPKEIMLCKTHKQAAYQDLLGLQEQIRLMRAI